ncbi:insecticidal delta-endotoxin Cry8Ea1 family protein [Bacillus cereus]|uniref:insecticidal delta-endotoxin Cry8Ea1 family protein n=1 Tax=Bacillus TaxID=1386 RepID=UPI0024B9508D|nr:insecticidal delta-endotoxin Cry8Ea1 family protein [Bacillus cereus]WHS76004.1 insecticidal delta-endotoxin Cry8Ea1 family protein [Bacillus cereus]
MKYKNRKHAKRKYKQTLLATVATMTLGLSVAGGTTPAFAAEEDNISVISAYTLNEIGTQTSPEEKEKAFWKKATAEFNSKNGKKFAGTSLNAFLNFAKSGSPESAQNALRAIVLASCDFVPYGMFVSPVIGYIWPEKGGLKEQLEKLHDQINEETDKKIAQQHLNDLNSHFDNLKDHLTRLENSVNGKNVDTYYSSQGSIEESRRSWVGMIEYDFGEILKLATQEAHKVDDLPLYTQVAAAHISFLKNLEQNGTGPKYKFDSQSLKDFYHGASVQAISDKYMKYIRDTYNDASNKNIEKITKVKEIGTDSLTLAIDFYDQDKRATLKQKLEQLKTEAQNKVDEITDNKTVFPGGWAAHGKELNNATAALDTVTTALNATNFLSNLNDTTVNDDGFNTVATLGKWIEKNGKHYYTNISGFTVTGWMNIGNSSYYLSEDDNSKGELVTGWFDTLTPDNKDRRYLFSPKESIKDGELFKQGEMVTGWIDATDNNGTNVSYYLSPEEEGIKNSAGELFTRGQMLTKWVEIEDKKTGEKHWYYFNPKIDDDYYGVMIRKQKAVQIGDKKYDFDSNGVCTTPNGY